MLQWAFQQDEMRQVTFKGAAREFSLLSYMVSCQEWVIVSAIVVLIILGALIHPLISTQATDQEATKWVCTTMRDHSSLSILHAQCMSGLKWWRETWECVASSFQKNWVNAYCITHEEEEIFVKLGHDSRNKHVSSMQREGTPRANLC